jgi:hypothetical protein
VFLSDGSSKTQQQDVLQKNRVEKFLPKKTTKNPKPIFCRFSPLCITFFGRFSVRGVQKQKHDKKMSKNNSDPGPFLASDPPTHHGPRG